MKRFLPLGSVVKITNIETRLMIVGFRQMEKGTDKIWDYCGVLFPNGMLDSENVFLFNEDIIETIYYIGAQDAEVFDFMRKLSESVAMSEEAENS